MKTDTNLEIINDVPMMGSRVISNMTGKDHSSVVVRDIKNMLEQLGVYPANLQDNENKSFFIKMKIYNGRDVIDEIFLDQDLSTTLVTGYSVQDRYKIIKRWSDLESGKALPLIAAQPVNQDAAMNNDILSLARVVAEATASATMKAVIDIMGIPKHQSLPAVQPAPVIAAPAQDTFDLQVSHHESDNSKAEFVPVADLVWACGFSDAACRRLVTFASLPTALTNGERGHLLIHREAFMAAAQTLLDESIPPTGKLKRWQHPDFDGFTLRLKSSETAAEA